MDRPRELELIRETEEHPEKCWDDFNHLETLHLTGSSTTIVYTRKTFDEYVLQYCKSLQWSQYRTRLIELTRAENGNPLFIATHFIFPYKNCIYVGSEVAYISLYDIISSTIPMTDDHISAILRQIGTQCQGVASTAPNRT
ncbi:hypothetical protein F5884DRAFT_758946 [Xylogone sp. PMI_703]|nr:hypothetical protein F5884DRAFT_758946 [Xylogone sp. PMI_703]